MVNPGIGGIIMVSRERGAGPPGPTSLTYSKPYPRPPVVTRGHRRTYVRQHQPTRLPSQRWRQRDDLRAQSRRRGVQQGRDAPKEADRQDHRGAQGRHRGTVPDAVRDRWQTGPQCLSRHERFR